MYIGIDLGGTNIAAGIVDENGKIIVKGETPTKAERSFEDIVQNIAEFCRSLAKSAELSETDISGIGIGSPGAIDNENGVVLNAANLNWTNAPLKAALQKYFNVPINIENDANAAAFGEYSLCGHKTSSFILVTLGTGIGGGIIIDGKIYRGFNGAGAEIGHSTLVFGGKECTCGKKGCWEAYGSVTGLIHQTKEAILKNPHSLMAELSRKNGTVNGRTAFDAAAQGDETAKCVVDRYIEYVADGICSLVNIFEPEILLIGGGISKEGARLLEPIEDYCNKNYFCKNVRQTTLGIAALGNDAGIIGAALSARS